ncbi:MAG TPA: hypothetical protein VMD58_06475 [Acidobacteriaceae bacterium]|nr:hypothetical protein [Acidobacteriaceae bacterium]
MLLRGLFGGPASSGLVLTHLVLPVEPEAIWDRIVLFEETTGRPPWLLRLFMPHPVRTAGDKSRAGALVHCIYQGGDLVKRILALDPPYRIVFEVIEQRLGIEQCVVAQRGSYEIDRIGEGSAVILTTEYRTYLHPRWLWRRLETLVARKLHLHILYAMQKNIPERAQVTRLSMTGAAAPTAQAAQRSSSTPHEGPQIVI